jgi:hypothetical protein
MEDKTRTPTEIIASILVLVIVFGFLWWKRRAQFGSSIAHAKVYVNDAQLRCHVCAGEHFRKREGLLNTQWLTLFRLEWLNESAQCICCVRCGYTHWFTSRAGASDPERRTQWIRYEGSAPRAPH